MTPTQDRHARLTAHQVHAAKLSADVSAAVVSTALLWRGRILPGLLARYLLPLAGSALVLSRGDVAAVTQTRRGRYVLQHMPPSMQALRLAGDTVMAIGAGRRQPGLLAVGAVIVIVGWSHGPLASFGRAIAGRREDETNATGRLP